MGDKSPKAKNKQQKQNTAGKEQRKADAVAKAKRNEPVPATKKGK